jgi:two-component system, cell cycle sensor histidine kinase and response regulator CckA
MNCAPDSVTRTRLGLATVYGIMRQSGGPIFCSSEQGVGASFPLYFPRVFAEAAPVQARPPDPVRLTGTETILVVEDEEAIRHFISAVLSQAGYTVKDAGNGVEALAFIPSAGARVDLLLTDIVMPVLSGKELGRRARDRLPGMRILYMSGYTGDAIAQHGILDSDVYLLRKPFTAHVLLRKMREILDRR